ncbi:MAG: ABC transporter permease [Chloroflexi bacterium]|nr:ABC transporter permease [Chloroflexota bacterium]
MATAETVLAQPSGVSSTWRRIADLRLPWFPVTVLSVIVFLAIFAPLLAPKDPKENNIVERLNPPFQTSENILGTDGLGKDVLSRLIFGSRTIMKITVPTMVVAILLGTTVGLVAGYAGRWVDSVLMRVTDAVMGFPSILVALLIVSLVGTGLMPVLIAVTATTWARFARMIRGEVLANRDRDFVTLARISGVSPVMIIWRHLFPNVVNTLMVITSITVGQVILLVASLSFLGLGLKVGEPAWGVMVAEGKDYISGNGWWLSLFPGIIITVVVMAFNLFGDWMRDYLDPKLRRSR